MGDNPRERNRKEILDTGKAFAKMVSDVGIEEAFLFYADENAVLNRNDVLINGINEIKAHFDLPVKDGATMTW